MVRAPAVTERVLTKRDLLGGLLLPPGLALAGYGSYLHFSIAARVSAGQCDGCAPWHPLFVVAPIVVGAALLTASGYLLSQ
ncbi:hypothetical protein ACFQJ5_15550 [Halomicroarcula sp. GCM10025324]|uniref:hypothetical protein n=1 Tax=Haloarcula TaxID=2237 RepID=UPI0023E86364|nr:hypothetical protein [Halomicroarcula sp. ZS-22-S1]